MSVLLSLTLLASLACLVSFQTSRSMLIRALGLFLILGVALIKTLESPTSGHILVLCASVAVVAVGFASDYYSASLRTWYFRAGQQASWGLIIGSMMGLLMQRLFPTLLLFILGSIIGAIIGEVRERGFRGFAQLSKAVAGTCVGIYGMSLKLLLGMEMIYWQLLVG